MLSYFLSSLIYFYFYENLGEYIKGGSFSERLTAKAEGGEILAHTRWSGGMGYLRRGNRIRDERFVSGRGVIRVSVCV